MYEPDEILEDLDALELPLEPLFLCIEEFSLEDDLLYEELPTVALDVPELPLELLLCIVEFLLEDDLWYVELLLFELPLLPVEIVDWLFLVAEPPVEPLTLRV